MLIKQVENLIRLAPFFQLDHDAHAIAVGFVAQIKNLIDPSLARHLRNALDQRRFIDLVRNFGNDDIVAFASAGFFEMRSSADDLHARIDDPDLDIDEDCVIVLRGAGPKGYPGMPEVSNTPLPAKLLAKGVRDMVRVCDGRMSGTAYGTVVLHVCPEAAAGGPLGKVRDGDHIILDVPGRRLDLALPADELAAREVTARTGSTFASPLRGYERLYIDHVLQANRGADLDFLVGASGDKVGRESH